MNLRSIAMAGLLTLLVSVALCSSALRAAEPKTLNVVVVTGGHDFDQKEFPKLFQGYDDIRVTLAHQKDDSELFEDISDWKYDVIVLYNMGQKITSKRQANFKALLERGVGLVALHHCIAAYSSWPEFGRIIGGKYFPADAEWDGVKHKGSTYLHDVDVKVKVEDGSHAITRGLKDFVIHDETYKGQWIDPKAHVLLTTTEPTSDTALAWCKTYANARVVYIQLGHGPNGFTDPNYRHLVSQGIRWAAPAK